MAGSQQLKCAVCGSFNDQKSLGFFAEQIDFMFESESRVIALGHFSRANYKATSKPVEKSCASFVLNPCSSLLNFLDKGTCSEHFLLSLQLIEALDLSVTKDLLLSTSSLAS